MDEHDQVSHCDPVNPGLHEHEFGATHVPFVEQTVGDENNCE
jgi:hypothetical protein